MKPITLHFALLLVFTGVASLSAQDDPATDSQPTLESYEIGAIPNLHRFGKVFLAGQPSLADLGAAKKLEGLRTILNLRMPEEMIDSGQEATLKRLEIEYHHLPFAAPDTLTDDVFDQCRTVISDRKKQPIMVHCKSANRVGAIWLVHRVLDDKRTYEESLAEAKEVGLRFAPYEQKAKAYIDRELAKQRKRAERIAELSDDWQYPKFAQDFGGGANGSVRNSVQKCKDDYGKVWEFYARKCGFEQAFSDKKLYRTVRSEGPTTYLLDDHPGNEDGKSVRLRTFFVCNSPGYCVSILVLRNDETPDAPTHVYRTITVSD